MYPGDAQDEQSFMKNADAAMYVAKGEGKNNFQFYSKDTGTQSLERLTLETSLRRALERNEFFLHYQAKLDLNTQAITGVEALLRWQHPDLGLVAPARFIPIAEETGLIVPIGRWVLKDRVRAERRLAAGGLAAVVHGGQSVGAPVRRREFFLRISPPRSSKVVCGMNCSSSSFRRAW
jgi:predicted signal transduction protein with EAL and GGDEF domain